MNPTIESTHKTPSNIFNLLIVILFVFGPLFGYIVSGILHIYFYNMVVLLMLLGTAGVIVEAGISKRRIIMPVYVWLYGAFVMYTLISDIWIVGKPINKDYFQTDLILSTFCMLIILNNTQFPRKLMNLVIRILTLLVLLSIGVILIQEYVSATFMVMPYLYMKNPGEDEYIKLNSIYSWISFTPGFSFIPIWLITVEYLYLKKQLGLFLLGLGILFAYLSRSRWILINALMVFVLPFVHTRDKFNLAAKMALAIPVVLIVTFLMLSSFGVNVTKKISTRLFESNKSSLEDTSAGTRILAFEIFGKLYPRNPVFGIGSRKYGAGGTGKHDPALERALAGRSSQIHVGYLSLLYYYGLVGGLIYLTFLFYLVREMYFTARLTRMWAPFLGIAGFVVANFTLVIFHMLEMGLILSLAFHQYYKQQHLIHSVTTNPTSDLQHSNEIGKHIHTEIQT